jgi:hypothetical protein
VVAVVALLAVATLAARAQGADETQPPVEPGDAAGPVETLPVDSLEWESVLRLDSAAHAAAVPVSSDGEGEAAAAEARSGSGAAAGGLSYDGLAAVEDTETVDGLSAQQSFGAGPRGVGGGGAGLGPGIAASSYAEGAVRSFRALPHDFSARFGGAAGGVLRVTTRGGEQEGARLHGSALAVSRSSVLAATNPFSVETHFQDGVVTSEAVKPAGELTELGGTVGAPLGGRWVPQRWRRRLWGFASAEAQLRDDTLVCTPAVASFFALTESQRALLGNRGVSAAAGSAALEYLDSLTGTLARQAYRVQGFGRVDAAATARDRVAVTYSSVRSDAPAGAALGQASDAVVARGRASVGDSVAHVDAVTAGWTHALARRWSNEVRGQASHELEFERPHAPLAQEPAISVGGYAPQVAIEPDGFAYGTPAALGRTAYPEEWRVQAADDLRWRAGRSTLSVGGDWSRVQDRIAGTTDLEGSFTYESGTAAEPNGLVNWITDYTLNVNAYPNAGCTAAQGSAVHDFCFNSYTQSFGPGQTAFVMHDFAGFAEDELRARKDLQLTLGVRYDYTLLPLPQTPNFTLDEAIAGLGLAVGGATARFPEDRNNVGVRFGAAWSPGWATVHVGYGVFYGRTPGATVRAALTETALTTATAKIRIRPATETQCPQVTTGSQGFGYPCAYTGEPPAAVLQTGSAMVFGERFRSPMVQRAALSVEREFGRRLSVRGSYAMALAVQLPQSVDLNIAATGTPVEYVLQGGDGYAGLHTGETFVVPLYTSRRIAQYGPVTELVSNANATYHAGTVEARWRGPGRLEVRGSYTFSRAIDYGPQGSATPAVNGQFDPYRDGYDKGLSSQNVPQRFAGETEYTVRVQRGGALHRALDGWRVAAIGTAESGAPYSYEVYGGPYLSGGRESMNGAGGAVYLPTVGRNTLRLAARGKVDARLGREFRLGQRLRMNGFAEAFNLLNSVAVSRVETRAFLIGTPPEPGEPVPLVFQDAAAIASEGLGTLPFGTPTSSTTGASRERQVELGVRVQF